MPHRAQIKSAFPVATFSMNLPSSRAEAGKIAPLIYWLTSSSCQQFTIASCPISLAETRSASDADKRIIAHTTLPCISGTVVSGRLIM
jgi:hypothetical protein